MAASLSELKDTFQRLRPWHIERAGLMCSKPTDRAGHRTDDDVLIKALTSIIVYYR